jgi:hypothetical protein
MVASSMGNWGFRIALYGLHFYRNCNSQERARYYLQVVGQVFQCSGLILLPPFCDDYEVRAYGVK